MCPYERLLILAIHQHKLHSPHGCPMTVYQMRWKTKIMWLKYGLTMSEAIYNVTSRFTPYPTVVFLERCPSPPPANLRIGEIIASVATWRPHPIHKPANPHSLPGPPMGKAPPVSTGWRREPHQARTPRRCLQAGKTPWDARDWTTLIRVILQWSDRSSIRVLTSTVMHLALKKKLVQILHSFVILY